MGADRLAFRTRRAFAGAAVEFRAHGRVLDLGGVDVTDPWLRHRCFSVSSCAQSPRWIRFVHHAPHARSHVAAWPQCDQPRSRVVDRTFCPVKPLRPAARAWWMARLRAAQTAAPLAHREGLLTIVT